MRTAEEAYRELEIICNLPYPNRSNMWLWYMTIRSFTKEIN